MVLCVCVWIIITSRNSAEFFCMEKAKHLRVENEDERFVIDVDLKRNRIMVKIHAQRFFLTANSLKQFILHKFSTFFAKLQLVRNSGGVLRVGRLHSHDELHSNHGHFRSFVGVFSWPSKYKCTFKWTELNNEELLGFDSFQSLRNGFRISLELGFQ